jgi:hypothetical protein
MSGRAWQEDGTLSSRYWTEAVKEKEDGSGIFYFWRGERPLHPDAPQLEGTGEIKLENADRASGYFITRADSQKLNTRTSGVYLRADPADMQILDGRDGVKRAALIADCLANWKTIKSS